MSISTLAPDSTVPTKTTALKQTHALPPEDRAGSSLQYDELLAAALDNFALRLARARIDFSDPLSMDDFFRSADMQAKLH